jgi:hypothetical protein
MAIPTKDSDLVAWTTNFDEKITALPADFDLTPADATAYGVVSDAYVASYNTLVASRESGVFSMALTTSKDLAKGNLLAMARELYAFIQDSTSVTDANKNLAGVKVKDAVPSVVPPPAFAPGLDIVSVTGRTVRIKLHDSQVATRKGFPLGVIGATVVSYVGTDTPTAASIWKYEGLTGRPVVDIVFPATVADGAKVWLAASWFNFRKENGPACTPVQTNVQGGAQAAA